MPETPTPVAIDLNDLLLVSDLMRRVLSGHAALQDFTVTISEDMRRVAFAGTFVVPPLADPPVTSPSSGR